MHIDQKSAFSFGIWLSVLILIGWIFHSIFIAIPNEGRGPLIAHCVYNDPRSNGQSMEWYADRSKTKSNPTGDLIERRWMLGRVVVGSVPYRNIDRVSCVPVGYQNEVEHLLLNEDAE
tara:strand:+ start:896 stop:1249 length:354 start_codon:yes stop_codon:yes gene_type:complete